LSGRILDKEAEKVTEGMKLKVMNRFTTGQCDSWKKIVKSSIVASMINVGHPYLLNTCDISDRSKVAENLLEIVLGEIKYAMKVLKGKIMAWCINAGEDSAKI
ncbi:hypothetical protein PAXRUDRAFT_78757, partial [Paxillus rubicundulus Ve08.2h10]